MRSRSLLSLVVASLVSAAAARAADTTVAGTATASAPSSTWIAFESPFSGDDDRDGWTVFALGLAAGGPFDVAETWKIPGPAEWRAEAFRGLSADTDYYVQVTYVDPDGVSGANPQVVGPVHTPASAPIAVTLGSATAEVRDTEIFVSQPIAGDANGNSLGVVEVATDPGGPWTERCGSPTENRLPYHPRRCRLRSLTPGTDYWVRIDNADPDGVSGTDPQILGPINYSGRANLAAGRPITADPGWGCCPNPAQLVDGRIQYRFWPFGFAWAGGTAGWGGGAPGWKQATIDLGSPSTFDRFEVWLHGSNSPPTDWRVETSDDGASWTEVWATTDPQCRGASEQLSGTSWQHPNCSQGALFSPTTARYVRYWFDDRTLFGGLHGWAVELEVFAPDLTAPSDPTSVASTTHAPGTWSGLQEITVDWSGASDAGGLAGYSVRFDTLSGFSTPHAYQSQWGSNGTGAGEFRETVGIALDAAGNVYVVDHQNHRVQVFDADGAFLRMWGWGVDTGGAALEVCDTASLPCQIGIPGSGAGQLDRPVGLAVSDSGVYVVDTQNSRIVKYDLGGGLVAQWGSAGTGAGQLTQPHGVAVDATGNVYVAESQAHRVQVFDAGGGFVRMWGWGVDTGAAAMEVCDTASLPCQAGSAGGGAGQFNVVEGVAVGASGEVYATDLLNQRVQVFGSTGSFVRTWGWGVDTGTGQLEVCDTTSLPCQAGLLGNGDGQFNSPEYLDLDDSGSVYVTGGAGHRVQKFDGAGGYLTQWGSLGTGSGEFNGPLGIAVGPSNTVYVADWANHRVQRFSDPTLPDETIDVAHVADPHSVTSQQLAEGQNHWFHLRTCDQAANCTSTVHLGPFWIDTTDPVDPTDVQSTSHTVGAPSSLNVVTMTWTPGSDAASGVDGYAWEVNGASAPVCDQGKDLEETATGIGSGFLGDGSWWFHLCTVDNAGNWTATATAGPYVIDVTPPVDPTSAASTGHDPGIWSGAEQITLEWSGASDAGSGVAGYSVLFNTSDPSTPPAFDLKWGSAGSGQGQFDTPAGVAVDAAGNVYIADYFNDRIQKFDPDGGYLDEWGGTGIGDGQFQYPADVAVDREGNVYVADTSNDRIQKFDPDGNYLLQWGTGHSGGDGEFRYPVGIAVDAAGEVYVADRDNHRIQVFSSDGTFLRKWGVNGIGDGEFQRPLGIAIHPSGTVYVVDRENHRVQKFDSAGTFLGKWGGYGTGDGQFDDPTFLAVDASSHVYVSDTANHRIQKFDGDGSFLVAFGSHGTGDGELDRPNGVAVVPAGHVYAVGQVNHRVQRFSVPTQPDTAIDVVHTADPHAATSAPLADGQDYWAHLRTCDQAGNCTATIHRGPYWIDTTPPVDPTDVQSTSHTVGVPSGLNSISMTWTAGSDPLSGLDGYAYVFDNSPTPACDETKDLEETATGVASGPVASGNWWFHICSVDQVGNWTSTVGAGPYIVDTLPPEVSGVNSVADTGDGVLAEGETAGVAVTQLLIAFDEPVEGAADPGNYLLLRDGGDGFQTASCAAGVYQGDEVIAIDSAIYAAATQTSTLGVHGGTPLFDGGYRLLVCGTTSVTDTAGNPLDGNGDGVGGDDFARNFTLSETRPTAHPGPDREVNVHDAIVLGDVPAATGGTGPYTYLWAVTPDTNVTLDSPTDANPIFSASLPEVCTAELVVTDANSLASQPASTEITVVCPALLELFSADLWEARVYESTGTITAEKTRVVGGAEVTFQAAEAVVLMDQFTVEPGATFTVILDPSTDCQGP